MSRKGKIYGLVGVIGSGKTYRAEQLQVDAACAERPMIMGDFSEGIRQTLMNIFTGHGRGILLDSSVYSGWKNLTQIIMLPTSGNGLLPDSVKVNGRHLLQRTGEYIKTLAGEDVWARWTANDITDKWTQMPVEEMETCDIVFGSLRFDCEAEALFRVAEITGKKVEIFFCNFKSDKYELNDHVSENFARYFLDKGCEDGEDITKLVKEKLNGRI
jgi:hypothetical protein